MQEPEDFLNERLKQLGAATDGVRPDEGFDQWIMAAVQREAGVTWFDAVWRAGRIPLLVGALAAAASIALAMQVRGDLDEQVMAAFEMVELDE